MFSTNKTNNNVNNTLFGAISNNNINNSNNSLFGGGNPINLNYNQPSNFNQPSIIRNNQSSSLFPQQAPQNSFGVGPLFKPGNKETNQNSIINSSTCCLKC